MLLQNYAMQLKKEKTYHGNTLGQGRPLSDPRGPVLRAGAQPRPHRGGALPQSGGLCGPRQGETAGGGGGGLQGRLSGGDKVLPQQDTPRDLVIMTTCYDLSEAAPFLLLLPNYAMRLKKPITETQNSAIFCGHFPPGGTSLTLRWTSRKAG